MREIIPYSEFGDGNPCEGRTIRGPKSKKTPSPEVRRQIKAAETERMRDRQREIEKRREALRLKEEGIIPRILSLDSTNIKIANGLGNRQYVEVGISKTNYRDATRVAGHQITQEGVKRIVGKNNTNLFLTVKVGDTRETQRELAHDIRAGRLDVGITTGAVPVKHLEGGLTVFSPLHFDAEGKTRVPEKPVTIIARVTQGKKR